MTVNTPADYGRKNAWLVVDQQIISFKVRACAEARILLSEDPFDMTMFSREIVIGGESNTKSGIYDNNNQSLMESNTPAILQCDELIDFWIRWQPNGGTITVGKGPIDVGVFLKYDEFDLHPFYAVSISTGQNNSGSWQLKTDAGEIM